MLDINSIVVLLRRHKSQDGTSLPATNSRQFEPISSSSHVHMRLQRPPITDRAVVEQITKTATRSESAAGFSGVFRSLGLFLSSRRAHD